MFRGTLENVLSGMKACFEFILNLEHPIERKKMFNLKSSSKLSATLLALILGASVFMAGPVWAAKYVTDPSTGKVVSAPQYGGTITFARKSEPKSPDILISGGPSADVVAGVLEKLAWADWATPRDKFDFQYLNVPTNTIGSLAESWSQPDPLTYIVKVRQGVNWHNKAPMNGRELTADDVVYNFHRQLGLGSGFTEPSEFAMGVEFESVTATDKWTVVFKLKALNLGALALILDHHSTYIYPPEVIKEHGDVTDWRNLVGTGPMMLTDWVEGSSVTFTKNPDYSGYDEKYPENRLPYIDQLRWLLMPEVATYMAALRTGKVDYIGPIGGAQMRSPDEVESLQRTNPEIVIWPFSQRSDNGFGMNVQLPYFSDIRVRKAMQMAIDLETINNAYYQGYADIIPQGQLTRLNSQAVIQFEEWPEDVKKVFDYDPEGAEALLDEAGYKRGADGIRFKTELLHIERYDLNYVELAVSYWKKIGIDVEIDVQPLAPFSARRSERDFEMINMEAAVKLGPLSYAGGMRYVSERPGFGPLYRKHRALHTSTTRGLTPSLRSQQAATTMEEVKQHNSESYASVCDRAVLDAILVLSPHSMWRSSRGSKVSTVKCRLGTGQMNTVFTRLWIDQELKDRTQ